MTTDERHPRTLTDDSCPAWCDSQHRAGWHQAVLWRDGTGSALTLTGTPEGSVTVGIDSWAGDGIPRRLVFALKEAEALGAAMIKAAALARESAERICGRCGDAVGGTEPCTRCEMSERAAWREKFRDMNGVGQ